MLKKFVIRAAIIYVVWLVLYYGIIIPDGRMNSFLTKSVIEGTLVALTIVGYESTSDESVILIDGDPVVLVADACNGLELFALFSGFILAFPGRIKYKLYFIPIGILLIYLINVIRELALALNYKFFQKSFELNHKYTYVFIVYCFVLLLWRFWLKRYSALVKN